MSEENIKKDNLWQEVKRFWLVFLLFGILSAAVSAGVSSYVSTKVTAGMQGPPCRVDFPVDEFSVNKSTNFQIDYLLINLRNNDLLIDGIDSYCYWRTQDEMKQVQNSVTNPPSIEQISTPRELDKIISSKSEVRRANCKSPDVEGNYKIRIIAKTTAGTCEGNILMEVKK